MKDRRARAADRFVCKRVDSVKLNFIAVGAANSKNPIAIIAPCHRVIGACGALTGFAGGLKAKATLLALEKAGV